MIKIPYGEFAGLLIPITQLERLPIQECIVTSEAYIDSDGAIGCWTHKEYDVLVPWNLYLSALNKNSQKPALEFLDELYYKKRAKRNIG